MTLDPRDGRSWAGLFESFQPPPGYRLSAALGTTFGLSLEALVAALLAMGESDPETMAGDSVAHVLAVTRLSSKVRVLTHPGTISGVPQAQGNRVVTLLDRLILEAMPPAGLFHPKVWALRFDSAGKTPRGAPDSKGRLVISSLNLGRSRSFEAGIVIEGAPSASTGGAPFSRDVATALEEWIGTSRKAAPPAIQELPAFIRSLALEIPREAEEDLQFRWQGGARGALSAWIPPRMSRLIVVSPFVRPDFVRMIAMRTQELQLIATREALDELSDDLIEDLQKLAGRNGSPVLYQVAELGDVDGGAIDGIHAKLLIAEEANGREVSFLGSANATGPGWGLIGRSNVEALAEMRPGVGVDSFQREFIRESRAKTHPWIVEYDRASKAPPDEVVETKQRLLAVLRQVAGEDLEVDYRQESRILELSSKRSDWCSRSELHSEVEVSPLLLAGRQESWALLGSLQDGARTYADVSLSEVTAFVAIRIRSADPPVRCERIVLARIHLSEGDLDRRDEAVCREILDGADPAAVLGALVHGLSSYRGRVERKRTSRDQQPSGLRKLMSGTSLEHLLQAVALQPDLVREIRLLLGHVGGPMQQLLDDLEQVVATVRAEAGS